MHAGVVMQAQTERNAEICQRHREGESFGQLAKQYGICRERIAQIWYTQYRPRIEFRFNERRRNLLLWIVERPLGKESVPNEWIHTHCGGEDVQALEDAKLVYWDGDWLYATDLGRDLLKWRPR
jgi:hypothetical protein